MKQRARALGRRVVAAGRRARAGRLGRHVASRAASLAPDAALLVEAGTALPGMAVLGMPVLVLGSDPYDERITCLADLRVRGALPVARFDLVALLDARPVRDDAVLDNALQALRPDGVLVCGSTRPLRRALRARAGAARSYGWGPWRITEVRPKGVGHG